MRINGIQKLSKEKLQKKYDYLMATGRAGSRIIKYIKFHLRKS
jgi:hypothetical protein